MKVVRKLLAPLLVVGILLTSLISLHQLKADKKKMCFVSVFRSLLLINLWTLLEKVLWMSWPSKAMLRGKYRD